MSVHKIRLAGPWEVSLPNVPAATDVSLPASTGSPRLRCQLPCVLASDGGADDAGSATPRLPTVLWRRFHRPSGLADGHRLRLVVSTTAARIALQLNGHPVDLIDASTSTKESPPTEVPPLGKHRTTWQSEDLIALLRPFNEAEIQVWRQTLPGSFVTPPSSLDAAYLEICEPEEPCPD